ncbi:hypothetical protein MN608_10222 [Microdochium nivale]|nr:hypothetical protein MN608_10222 [Microdochium nivale]
MSRIAETTQLRHHLQQQQQQHTRRTSISSDDVNSYTSEAIAGVITGCIIGIMAFMITLYSVRRFLPLRWRTVLSGLPQVGSRDYTSTVDTDNSFNTDASISFMGVAETRTPPRPQRQRQMESHYSRESAGGPGTGASGGGSEGDGDRERAVTVGV